MKHIQEAFSLDLAKTPLARRGSRPVLLQLPDGCYLGLKPAGNALPFAQVFGGTSSMGILRIQIMDGGKELPYSVNAGPFIAELITGKGRVRFAIDKAANALRMEGDVPQLRLSSPLTGANSVKYADGVETNLGGRVVHRILRGTFEFDDSWMLKRWSSVPPCLDIMAVDGRMEAACIELPADTDVPEITRSLDECAAENKADFEAFCDTLKPTDGLTAYRLWSEARKTGSAELACESYLFSDPRAVFELALASAEAGKSGITPLFGAVVLRMRDEGMLEKISEEDIARLREALKDALAWWRKYRFDTARGRYFYAYRDETGEENPQWFGEAPVYAPQLQERLSQLEAAVGALEWGGWN